METIRIHQELWGEFWQLRRQLFEELGEITVNERVGELETTTKNYFLSHIDNDLIAWGISDENKIIAIGSLCLFERIPYPGNLMGKEGYILNIYTCPRFRKQGLAARLVDEILKYASENRIKRVWLSSSKKGVPLYTARGFIKKSNEMELFL